MTRRCHVEIKRVLFKQVVSFLGRNGYFKAIGVEIMVIHAKDPDNSFVSISPITSKGDIGRAVIEVPLNNVNELIEGLKELSK